MGAVIYNGESTEDQRYDLKVWSPPDYEIPERDIEEYHVPGRSGSLIVDYGSYKNVDRSYTISCGDGSTSFITLARRISIWCHTVPSYTYSILQDTYEPAYYRLALPPKVESITNLLDQAAMATVTFSCKPQRFLISGDTVQTFTTFNSSTKITNDTQFSSKPIIKVYGGDGSSGTVTFKSKYTVSISSLKGNNTAVVIDSELMDCYYGTTNANNLVTMSNGFPLLEPGDNKIEKTGAVSKVEVIPKWWVI